MARANNVAPANRELISEKMSDKSTAGVPPQMNIFFSSENLKGYRAIKINISYLNDTDPGANVAII